MKDTITFSSLSPQERAQLVRAALETEESRESVEVEIPDIVKKIPDNITQDSFSREQWLYMLQDVLADEEVPVESQAEITRAAFNRHEETKKKRAKEVKIVSQLVRNLSVSDEVSLMDEINKAIKRAEQENQFSLLRKLLSVYMELEQIAGAK